jgi:hypothetical protein
MCRASEAQKILSVNNESLETTASHVAIAEITQIAFFALQTVIYTLAFLEIIPPLWAGITSFILLPIEAVAVYNTLVHYKKCSRLLMTIAAIFMLSVCAGFACMNIIADSTISFCVSGVVLHISRNLSEYFDSRNAQKDPAYKRQVLNSASL